MSQGLEEGAPFDSEFHVGYTQVGGPGDTEPDFPADAPVAPARRAGRREYSLSQNDADLSTRFLARGLTAGRLRPVNFAAFAAAARHPRRAPDRSASARRSCAPHGLRWYGRGRRICGRFRAM